MQGLSLYPKDYEARKLDKVKDAFKCPDGKCLTLVLWNDNSDKIGIGSYLSFNDKCNGWQNYATPPGYEIPDEWRTYKEPEKPRRMTRGELARTQFTGLLEISHTSSHSSVFLHCNDENRNDIVDLEFRCRPWGTSEWLEPTVDLLPKEWGVK